MMKYKKRRFFKQKIYYEISIMWAFGGKMLAREYIKIHKNL